ncbi:unnamed protein product, partial [Didymodactylos carnosus]
EISQFDELNVTKLDDYYKIKYDILEYVQQVKYALGDTRQYWTNEEQKQAHVTIDKFNEQIVLQTTIENCEQLKIDYEKFKEETKKYVELYERIEKSQSVIDDISSVTHQYEYIFTEDEKQNIENLCEEFSKLMENINMTDTTADSQIQTQVEKIQQAFKPLEEKIQHEKRQTEANEDIYVKHIVNHEDFEKLVKEENSSKKLILIDFTATWCSPCQAIKPWFIAQAKLKYNEIIFVKVDVDENEETSAAYKINAMPTFVFIKDQKEIVEARTTGADKVRLLEMIEKYK